MDDSRRYRIVGLLLLFSFGAAVTLLRSSAPTVFPNVATASTSPPARSVSVSAPQPPRAAATSAPPSPPLNPRVAVCVVGGVRSMRLVLPSIFENLIDALQPDASRRHVFFELHTDAPHGDCIANENAAHRAVECVREFKRTTEWMRSHPAFYDRWLNESEVTVHLEDGLRCSHPFTKSHPCCVRDARAMNDEGPGYLWGMAQYMRRRLCYDRIMQHEAAHNVTFDLVAFTRPDVAFLEPVPPAEYFLRIAHRIHATTKDGGRGWGDSVFIMPRNLASVFDRVMDAIFTQRECDTQGRAPNGRLNDLMDRALPAQRSALLQAVVVPSSSSTDVAAACDAQLRNDVNDAGGYIDDRSGVAVLVSIAAVCQIRTMQMVVAIDPRPPPTPPLSLPPPQLKGPPRVAVCLSGGTRTLRLALPSIVENFVNELQPDPALRHVFLEVTSVNDCFANMNNRDIAELCQRQFEETAVWMRDRQAVDAVLGGASTINVVNDLTCTHPFLEEHICCIRDPRNMNDSGEGFFWGMAQYMRRRLCYDRILKHEAAHNVTFDLVAFTRPDMAYLEPVPPAEYFLGFHPPRITVINKDDALGDFIFVAPRSLSDTLNEGFDVIFSGPCKRVVYDRRSTPEQYLEEWINGGGIAHQRWPFQAALVRSATRADCQRLRNGLNDQGRYVCGGGDRLCIISDRCVERTGSMADFSAQP